MSLKISDGSPWFKKSGNNVVFSLRIDENVYDVIKHDLPKLKDVLQQIIDDLKISNQAID